jgi:hypothetical protein
MKKEEIAKKILVDEDELFERIVDKASRIFKLDKRGNMVWTVSLRDLTDKEKVALVLVANFIGNEIGLFETKSISNADIAQRLNMSSMSVGARMAELRDQRIAMQEKMGVHSISLSGIDAVLDGVLGK